MAAKKTTRKKTKRGAPTRSRRDEIIQIARRIFARQGYAGTTMSDVFSAMGGSRATLYGHFRSKDELFKAVLQVVVVDYRIDFEGILQPQQAVHDVLLAYCQHFLERVLSPEGIAFYRLTIDAVEHFPRIGGMFYEEAPQMSQHLLENYFREVIARGHLSSGDPRKAAIRLSSLCTGGLFFRVMWGVEKPTLKSIAAEAAFIVELFFDGGTAKAQP